MKPLWQNVLLKKLEWEGKTSWWILIKETGNGAQRCEVLATGEKCSDVSVWDKVLVMWYLLEMVSDIEKTFTAKEEDLLGIIVDEES